MTTGQSLWLKNGKVEAKIALCGAELKSLRFADHEFIWQGDPAWWSFSAPLLFPVIGRLPDQQIKHQGTILHLPPHGFARDLLFSVDDVGPAHVHLSLHASPATLEMYPFKFELHVRFELSGDSLQQQVRIANAGDEPMPASFGFHPGFCWPVRQTTREAHSVRFTNSESPDVYRVGKDGHMAPRALPLVQRDRSIELHDALFADGAIVLNPVSSNGLEYRDQNGLLLALRWSGCEQLGLWSLPGAPFVCFEPWHGHPSPSDFAGELSGKPGGFVLQPQQSKLFELKASF
jgi:galactose mutarotase-like enzyme